MATNKIHFDVQKSVKCPYCGNDNHVIFKHDDECFEVWTCDSEDGGCDKHFAVSRTYELVVEPKAHKIEGEG